ncbi:energy transducer TonB [Alteromonas aestuariivivens]|uniref:Protein TonB n=1 Tax=Alteromonas aestuariivivens TaxID=1938339 RepID=A0A3D8MEQ9_9ALTE|nr:energy transducer TonB [Alteromonas aestuariivivens]RDV29242.1 energy transducer TonB [Alteromonas aestuariivivens]
MLNRFVTSFIVATGIGLVLFFLMELMIKPDDELFNKKSDTAYLNFVRVTVSEQSAKQKDRQLPDEPPPPEQPPQTPDVTTSDNAASQSVQPLAMNLPSLDMPLSGGDGPFLGAPGSLTGGVAGFDSDVIPVVQVAPVYPRNAKQAKIEGYVKMSVSIRPDGTVANAKVIESNPRRLFDKAAITAMMRWKFRPKIVDGQPEAQTATQTIEFTLADS